MKFTLVVPLAPERDAPILEDIKKLNYPKNQFHVLVSIGRNPSLNRNKGIDNSKGEFVVFLDDDAYIDSSYLNKVDEFFSAHPNIDVVGGPQLTPYDDSQFGKISGYALSSKFGAWKLSDRYSLNKESFDVNETSLTSANLICRKKVVENVKFDEKLFPGEDPKFISDVKKQGFKIAYSPKIIVYHKRRPNYNAFVKQMFNYGKTRPKKENFFETLKKPFFLIPSLFFIYLGLLIGSILINPSLTRNAFVFNPNADNAANLAESSLLTGYVIYSSDKVSFNLGFLWFFPLMFYLLLVIIFSFFDSIKNNDLKAIFVLPFIYPTIHLSYGLGMIYGWARKV
ncbi:MAG: glycosyltransferase [Nanoarchaeota archaeon]